MKSAAPHSHESQRVTALKHYEILDSEDEAAFDELTELASTICGTPISLISLVDEQRQWFKSRVGLGAKETDRSLAFCAHAILQDQIFEIPDATKDIRFADNPLVTEAPDIRFYAGAPLVTPEGLPIGTLCVIDTQPKTLSTQQKRALEVLSKQVISQLELRVHNRRLQRLNKNREHLFAMLAHDLRSPFNIIIGMSKILSKNAQSLSQEKILKASQDVLHHSLEAYRLLDEILQWSQQTLGTLKPKLQTIALDELVTETLTMVNPACQHKTITIDVDIPAQLIVFADSVITKSVLRNLLTNAIKFSPINGKIHIDCLIHSDRVEIGISNQGTGISQTVIDSLFKASVESSMGSIGESGSGLGLMLCAQFLQMQDNRIWHDAEYQNGTRIAFDLNTSVAI